MKLIDLITAQSARLKQAGVSFGHGTTNAFDEAAWLVLFALGLPLDALEERAQRELPPEEQAKAEALVTRRIETRHPAAYLTKEAWLQNVPFYVDERVIVPRTFIDELIVDLAMPFVRYDTGDVVHWHSMEPARSGIAWPRLGQLEGRSGDVIYLPSGRSIPMPGLTLVMRWLDGLKSYQFIQTGPDSVTVRLDRGSGFSSSETDVLAFLKGRTAHDVKWTIIWAPPELTINGKLLIIRNDWLRQQGLTRPSQMQ